MWCLPPARSLPPPCGNRLSPYRSFLCKLSIRSLPASSPTWHGRRAISPASPISSFRSEGSGCSCLRNARPVLTELRWFLIRPIRHGLHICARLRLPRHRGVRLIPAGVRDAAEITQRVATFARDPNGALVVLPGPVTIRHRETIIVAAARHRLPTIYPYRFFTIDGGLMSYASDVLDSYRRAASYVDRIFRGAKVAELPVQQPSKYELTINVQTAKTLGLALPDSVLATADEVIE